MVSQIDAEHCKLVGIVSTKSRQCHPCLCQFPNYLHISFQFFYCKDFHVNFDIPSMSVSCISLSLMSVSPRIMIIPSLRVDCPASPREF